MARLKFGYFIAPFHRAGTGTVKSVSLPGRCQDRRSWPLHRRRTRDTGTRRRSSPTACGCITGFRWARSS